MSSHDLQTFSDTAVGTDSNTPENLSEIPGKSSEIPNKIEDPQITSYGIIQDPTLQSLALALPFCPDRQEKLLRAVYLEDWVKYTNMELEPAQKLHSHLLSTIMDPHYPEQLLDHSLFFNMFVHWDLGWNGLSEFRKESTSWQYHYLTEAEFQRDEDLPVGGAYLVRFKG